MCNKSVCEFLHNAILTEYEAHGIIRVKKKTNRCDFMKGKGESDGTLNKGAPRFIT